MAIRFASEVARTFDAVARRFDLSRVLANEHEVRYENERVILAISFDNGRSYELEVAIGRKNAPSERPFSLGAILRTNDRAEAVSTDGWLIGSPERLADALQQLSELTSRHAADLLMGDDLSFARVAELQRRETEADAIDRKLRDALARSDAAWAKRDYRDVVSALAPVEPLLSPAEKKRLDYSRRKLAP